jgi:hypothetical protein
MEWRRVYPKAPVARIGRRGATIAPAQTEDP